MNTLFKRKKEYKFPKDGRHLETRLKNTLDYYHIEFHELQYISRQEFADLDGVGKTLMRYVDAEMESLGLKWGKYSIKYFLDNKEFILISDGLNIKAPDASIYRMETARSFLNTLIEARGQAITQKDVLWAINLSDTLITQLKTNVHSTDNIS